MPRALIRPGGARGGASAPGRHTSPLLQVPRALTQGGGQARWRPSSADQGWGRQNQRAQRPRWDQNSHTAGTRAAPQSRATGAEGPDMAGTGRFPAGAKGPDTGGAPSRPECRITGNTPQRQGTRPGGSRFHFLRPTSSSRTRWFSTRARLG